MKLAESILSQLCESLTKNQIQSIASTLDSLRGSFGRDGQDPVEVDIQGNSFEVSKSYRNRSLFTARDGEEDDDNPIFSGIKEVEKKAKERLKEFKKIKIRVMDHEKSWFSIHVTGAYDSSSDNLPIEKRPIGNISKEEAWKWMDANLPSVLQPTLSKIGKVINFKDLELDTFWMQKSSSGDLAYYTDIPMGGIHTTEQKSGHIKAISGKGSVNVYKDYTAVEVYPKSTGIDLGFKTPERVYRAELKGKRATLENIAKELIKCAKAWEKYCKEYIKKRESEGWMYKKSSSNGFLTSKRSGY
jgi:hypothetical protein